MLEKLLDLLKLILEKYLIPALIAVFVTIFSVKFFTDKINFLRSFTLTENYIFQGLFYFLIILAIYSFIRKIIEKNEAKHRWDEWDKESLENLINQIDTYPNEIRQLIKNLFYNGNQPIILNTDFYGASEVEKMLYGKVTFSLQDEDYEKRTYLCRFSDSFYEKLQKLYKEKGCISHY